MSRGSARFQRSLSARPAVGQHQTNMPRYEHVTTARVTAHTIEPRSGVGRSLTYRVVFLDPAVEARMTFGRGNRLRFVGEFEGVPVQGAWQSAPGKGHYAMLSEATLAQAGRGLGDEATLAFNVVGDDFVLLPDDVERALSASSLRRRWEAISASERRARLAHLESAKTPATRARRLDALLDALVC